MRRLITVAISVGFSLATARANLTPSLVSVTSNTDGTFNFNYQAALGSNEQLNPAATSSDPANGCPILSEVNCDPFFTIYDLPDGSLNNFGASVSGWAEAINFVGITPSGISGSFDDPNLLNVTFFYTGPIVNGPAIIGGFFLNVNPGFGNTNTGGAYTSQSTENNAGHTTVQLRNSIGIPSSPSTTPVPEPSTPIFVATGLLGAAILRRQIVERLKRERER